MYELLRPEIQYNLGVTVVEFPKEFPGPNGSKLYSHKIVFKDKFGKDYKGDYVSMSNSQRDFVVGEFATFRVTKVEPGKTPLIEPIHNSGQEVEKKLILSAAPPIQGMSFAYALNVASNILVAEKQGISDIVSEADIDRLLVFADRIDEWLISKQEQRITDEVSL